MRGGVSRFSVVIISVVIIVKNVGKGWDSNPYLPLQNPVVLPTVPWEPLEFLTNVSEIMKIFGATETRTPTYRLRTLLSYPLCHGNHWYEFLTNASQIMKIFATTETRTRTFCWRTILS